MSDIDELRKEKAKKAADKEKTKLLNADRIEQQQQYETIVDQKRRYVSRTKHSVKDDVKYGILPKEALVIEPMHKIGIPTGTITSGVIAVSDMSAFLTMSDKKLCEYYANYDKIVKEKKQTVSNIVKAVDRQEESLMSAKSDLASAKLRYSTYKTRIKLQERFGKASGLLRDVESEDAQGMTADVMSIDERTI